MKKIAIILLCLLWFFPAFASAEKLVFGVVEWPPFVIVKDGEVKGISPDITREVCKRIGGLTAEFQVLPLKRAFKYLKEGKSAMSSIFYKKDREAFAYFSTAPQYLFVNALIGRKGQHKGIKSLADLKGKSVIIMSSYHYSDEFDKNRDIKKMSANTLEDMFQLFLNERADFIATELSGFRYICREKALSHKYEQMFVISEKPLFTVFPKKWENRGAELAEKFGKTLQKMKEDGTIQKIAGNYF